jgi:hypothetical protein
MIYSNESGLNSLVFGVCYSLDFPFWWFGDFCKTDSFSFMAVVFDSCSDVFSITLPCDEADCMREETLEMRAKRKGEKDSSSDCRLGIKIGCIYHTKEWGKGKEGSFRRLVKTTFHDSLDSPSLSFCERSCFLFLWSLKSWILSQEPCLHWLSIIKKMEVTSSWLTTQALHSMKRRSHCLSLQSFSHQ